MHREAFAWPAEESSKDTSDFTLFTLLEG